MFTVNKHTRPVLKNLIRLLNKKTELGKEEIGYVRMLKSDSEHQLYQKLYESLTLALMEEDNPKINDEDLGNQDYNDLWLFATIEGILDSEEDENPPEEEEENDDDEEEDDDDEEGDEDPVSSKSDNVSESEGNESDDSDVDEGEEAEAEAEEEGEGDQGSESGDVQEELGEEGGAEEENSSDEEQEDGVENDASNVSDEEEKGTEEGTKEKEEEQVVMLTTDDVTDLRDDLLILFENFFESLENKPENKKTGNSTKPSKRKSDPSLSASAAYRSARSSAIKGVTSKAKLIYKQYPDVASRQKYLKSHSASFASDDGMRALAFKMKQVIETLELEGVDRKFKV